MSIVVGVDGSSGSKAALRWAVAEAELRGTEVDAVFAWSLPEEDFSYPWWPVGDDSDLLLSVEELADKAVAEAVSQTISDSEPVTIRRRAIEGSPATVLVEESEDAEMLVVGSSARKVKKPPFRSVGFQCAQHALCPIVIVRDLSPGRERPVRSRRPGL